MLLCFDYDGVIVDSLLQQLRIVTEAQRRIGDGRAPILEDFRSIEDLSYEGFARHIGLAPERTGRWKELVVELLEKDTEIPPLIPQVDEALPELATRFPVVIVTSNARSAVERALQKHALSSYVQDVFDGTMRGSKGEKIRRAAEQSGIPLSATYMIGDTRSDIRHAKAVGAKALAALWGYQNREALEKEQPDALLQLPRELLSYFGTLDVH